MTRLVGRAFALVGLLVVLVLAGDAVAHEFFGSSPGPLTQSTRAFDGRDHCNDCQVDDSKERWNDKCLTCHDHQNLSTRIAAGSGFHASPVVKGKKCESCHHEHKGKRYDLMGWASV